jgi:hypothetical protein
MTLASGLVNNGHNMLRTKIMKRGMMEMLNNFYKTSSRLSSIFVVFLLILSSQLYAEECVYNENIFNKKYFLSNTTFKDCQWNDKQKEATVTISNNEKVKVKYYACQHFGMTASLAIENAKIEPSKFNWKEKILWLGDHVLNKQDLALLVKAAEEQDLNKEIDFFLMVGGSKYIEFVVAVRRSSSNMKIEISWYY